MNKPYIYLPLSFLVILSIVYISLSVPSFSLILHFTRLLYPAGGLAILTALVIYFRFRQKMDGENLYMLTGSSLLFSFVMWFAFVAFCNWQSTTKNCEISSYEVISYKGRMASGYGKLEKGQIKANQWILTIRKAGEQKTFVIDKDISHGNRVTNSMDLQFCKGLLGTEYLNVKQLVR